MILSDLQSSGTSMATCGETSISTFSHIICSDLRYSPPAEVTTFAPSMTAMLNESFPMDMSLPSEEATVAGALATTRLGDDMEDIENSKSQLIDRFVKVKNTELLSSLTSTGALSEYHNCSSRDETENTYGTQADTMLSQQKSLPDINCFIQQDQNRLGVRDDAKANFVRSKSDSYEILRSSHVGRDNEDKRNSESPPPVFAYLTVRNTRHQNHTRRWSNASSSAMEVQSTIDPYHNFGFGEHQPLPNLTKPEKEERYPLVSGRSPNSRDVSILHDEIFYSDSSGHVTHSNDGSASSRESSQATLKLENAELEQMFTAGEIIESRPTCHGDEEQGQLNPVSFGFSNNREAHYDSDGRSNFNPLITLTSMDSHALFPGNNNSSIHGQDIKYEPQEQPKPENTVFLENQAHEQYYSNESLSCLEIENLVGPCMEEMKGIILKEIIKDVDVACSSLELSVDPQLWTEDHVEKWVNWTIKQYNLPFCDACNFRMSGQQLCKLSEAEMCAIAPKCGEFLHAHLEIWTTVVESSRKSSDEATISSAQSEASATHCASEIDEEALRFAHYFTQPSGFDSQSGRTSLCNLRQDENAITVMTPNHTAGIHLWQFLKELLIQPQLYGQYIRWISKENGIFKIEDSVEVARLWGIRKNRPAMNYDKLSRSIRQYYKKGIIKKTEVSQRLVYQFVKPVI